MEENTAKVNEIEEYQQPEVEVEEAPEESGGAFVAGVVGGFLAYATIGGVKKLAAFARAKWAERKQKDTETVIEADYKEVPDEQEDSEKDASEEE